MGRTMAVGVLLAVAVAAPVQAQTDREPVLGPCDLVTPAGDTIPPPTRCGWFPVPENRDQPGGRWLRLNVVVIGAVGSDRLADPMVRLFGGPGQAAAQFARYLAPGHRRSWPGRDLVLVDQRGTGESNGLYCDGDVEVAETVQRLVARVMDVDAMQACREMLQDRADLSHYHTTVAADDLAEVLTWLGYEQVNLSGGSYGTRMAQVFMRRYPERVRTAILDGVVPMDAFSPRTYSPESTDAMKRLVLACVSDPECGAAYPDLENRTTRVFERLDQGDVTVTVTDPRDGARVEAAVPKETIGYAVRGMLYSGRQFPDLPALLNQAFEGDYGPLVDRFVGRTLAFGNRAIATGMYFSVFCTEDIPFIGAADVEANRGTIMDDALIREYRESCEGWPTGQLPAGFHDPVSVDVPTLVISGEFDPSTTSQMGADVASHLTDVAHILIPGGGHGTGSNPNAPACVQPIQQAFVQAGTARGLDVSCVAAIEPPAFRVPD